jgi:hypothetical protein
MTNPSHDEPTELEPIPELDAAARAAARGLTAHVRQHLDAEAPIGLLPAMTRPNRPQPRRRLLAVAAALALVAGVAATIGDDDGATRVEIDDDSEADSAPPDLEPGTLTPLGPRDGKDSIRLPLTAKPSDGLVDGQEVTVSAQGFQPGEGVGLVQCAKEAAGDAPETRAGVDACYIGDYTSITADDQGVATGVYKVHRLLTTSLTGTVDCAADPQRCVVAMGALSDYDRSGIHPIAFDPNVEPVALPTVTVTPTEGLRDGDIVHVVMDGLPRRGEVSLQVCSSDPVACWYTNDTASFAEAAPDDQATYDYGPGSTRADADGHLEVDVPVWQYLPGETPGTYVDCAVSRCSLRFGGDRAPATVPLHFLPGDGPIAPTFTVEPSTDLAIGDEVVIRGSGARPGAQVMVSLCAYRGDPLVDGYSTCASGDQSEAQRAGDDGSFTITLVIPTMSAEPSTTECSVDGGCYEWNPGPDITCDGTTAHCVLQVDAWSPHGGPTFVPTPVPVTFR